MNTRMKYVVFTLLFCGILWFADSTNAVAAGAADIPLAASPVVTINPKDPTLLSYQKNAVQTLWKDDDYGQYYSSSGYTNSDLGIAITDRTIEYIAVPYLSAGSYYIPAELLSLPEMGCWKISRSENGSTWHVHMIKDFLLNENGGYIVVTANLN